MVERFDVIKLPFLSKLKGNVARNRDEDPEGEGVEV
jgi:hypothetical protein